MSRIHITSAMMLSSQTITDELNTVAKPVKSEEKNIPAEVLDIARILAMIAVEDFFQERAKK
jgi:hypothetical protein